jgi:YVTN family beta-propeller protein
MYPGTRGRGLPRRNQPQARPCAAALFILALAIAACGTSQQTGASPPLPVLTAPAQLAAYRVFVTDLITGDVAELGVQTIHVARSVHGLALSADKRSVYVTDVAGSMLDVFALQNGRLGAEHSAAVGSQPVHMVGSRDGRNIYVANFDSQSVSVVATESWTKTSDIAVPAHPFAIVLSPDGHFAYVACGAGPAVAVIDTASNTLAATISLPQGTQPYGIGISADGHYVYATDNAGGQLLVMDTTTRSMVGSLALGMRPALMARSPDGATLYVSNGASHSVSVVDLAKDPAHPTVRATVNVTGYPHGIDVTPDGRYVVVAGTTGNSISVIDTTTLTSVASVSGEQDPNDVLIAA